MYVCWVMWHIWQYKHSWLSSWPSLFSWNDFKPNWIIDNQQLAQQCDCWWAGNYLASGHLHPPWWWRHCTPSEKLVGRLHGFDPCFSRYLGKFIEFWPRFNMLGKKRISIHFFRYFREKSIFDPIFAQSLIPPLSVPIEFWVSWSQGAYLLT